MAELVLTKEEEEAPSYLDWSDETLAKAVRALAANLKDDVLGKAALGAVALVNVLVKLCHDTNTATTTIRQEGVTHKDEQLGDWVVTVQRIKK